MAPTRIRRVPAVWLAAMILAGATAASAAPTITALRPVVRLPAGAQEGVSELILQATGPEVSALGGRPVIADEPPNVVFGEAIEISDGREGQRIWRVPVTVKGLPAAGGTFMHTATVTWNQVSTIFRYLISNAAVPALSWKVSGLPGEFAVQDGWCQPVRIAASGSHATGILLTSTLVEQSTKHPLTGFFLRVGGTRADPVSLEAAVNESTRPIDLCLDNRSLRPGKYQGLLNISAAEKPEGDPQSLTVYVTTWWAWIVGILLLTLGCIAAYLLRVLAPARIAQRQALLAASVIREQAAQLLQRLDGIDAPSTRRELETIVAQLEKRTLIQENLVSPDVPIPFGGTPDAPRFKARLEQSAALVSKLAVVVEGIETARRTGGANAAQLVAALDVISEDAAALTLHDVTARVRDVLANRNLEQAAPVSEEIEPSAERLVFQIAQVSSTVWTAVIALTWAVGLFVLVLNNPGFGVPMDFLYCLLWGFGIPAVGQQLTSASATSALGISVPSPRS